MRSWQLVVRVGQTHVVDGDGLGVPVLREQNGISQDLDSGLGSEPQK